MPPSALVFPSPSLPSQQQMALAIAIIRSKPSGTKLRDHMTQLRAHIKRGQDPFERANPCCYVDQVAYWKERCKHAEDERDRLANVNVKLERSNKLLSSLSSNMVNVDASVRARTESPARDLKRPRQTKRALDPVASAQETVDNDLDFLEALGKDGIALVEALFNVHSLCRATDPDTNILCTNLVRSASAMGKIIFFVARKYESLSRQGHKNSGATSLDKDKSEFANALSVCARTFMSILVGADKLMRAESDKRLESLIVCELAEMFKMSLSAIATSAEVTAKSVLSQPPAPKKRKSKACSNTVKESAPARAVAHLLISFLGLLEKNDSLHQKIFDGFVFILFERVGKRLYYSTFGQHRTPSIERNILPVPQAEDAAGIFKCDCDALAMRLEARALILILERAMGLAPNHMNSQNARVPQVPTRASRTLSVKAITTTSRARLSPLAKDRLQRTLIACMYGYDSTDEFLDILTKPMPQMRLGTLQNVAKAEDEDVETWYKEEVWRLVGWDILARENGW